MKKLLGVIFLAGTLTGAGCVTTASHDAAKTAPTTPLTAVKTPPPVTPDQVTATNGHEIAQKLAVEMERDTKEP